VEPSPADGLARVKWPLVPIEFLSTWLVHECTPTGSRPRGHRLDPAPLRREGTDRVRSVRSVATLVVDGWQRFEIVDDRSPVQFRPGFSVTAAIILGRADREGGC